MKKLELEVSHQYVNEVRHSYQRLRSQINIFPWNIQALKTRFQMNWKLHTSVKLVFQMLNAAVEFHIFQARFS